MTLASLLGLLAMALVWMTGLAALAWSWRRSVIAYQAAGIDVPGELHDLKATNVVWSNVRRHTAGWTAFLFGCFLVLAAIGLPLWARLGMALVLGIYYGSVRIANESEGERTQPPPLFSASIDKVWYPGVATLEWCGYLGVLVFFAQLASEALL